MNWITLVVFATMGLAAFDAVSTTFWMRDHVSLSAAELIEIGIYTQLPWSIKILFGSIIDLHPNRKLFVYLGAALQALGYLLFYVFVTGLLTIDEYHGLLYSGLLTTIGIVFTQATASTLAVEMAGSTPYEQGKTQVANRIAFSAGALIAAFSTGYLASYPFEYVSLAKILLPVFVGITTYYSVVPLISSNGSYYPLITANGSYWKVLLGTGRYRNLLLATLFGLFCILVRNQWMIFCAQMLVINYLLYRIGKGNTAFLLGCCAIFLFRIVPGYGPGYTWWTTEALGFDATFLGHLRLVSTVADLVVLGLLAKWMAKGDIYKSLLVLTIAGAILTLPDFIVYYQLSTVNPRHIMLIDTALIAPLADLSMIPLGILIALNAPKEGRAMYMSLTASFMNMALVGSDLITKYLNQVYEVTRTDFSQLGKLMLAAFAIGNILSIIGLLILRRSTHGKKKMDTTSEAG